MLYQGVAEDAQAQDKTNNVRESSNIDMKL